MTAEGGGGVDEEVRNGDDSGLIDRGWRSQGAAPQYTLHGRLIGRPPRRQEPPSQRSACRDSELWGHFRAKVQLINRIWELAGVKRIVHGPPQHLQCVVQLLVVKPYAHLTHTVASSLQTSVRSSADTLFMTTLPYIVVILCIAIVSCLL